MKDQFRTEEERKVNLSSIEARAILAADPEFKSVSKSSYFDNYDLPCPVRVEVNKKDGGVGVVVLRKTRHGEVQKEAPVLKALNEFGLPVPTVMAEPFENEQAEWCAVYSLLPGKNLQKLSSESEEGLEQAKELLINAVKRLASTGEYISRREEFKDLPRITLTDDLEALTQVESDWLIEPLFQKAIACLKPKFMKVTTPLVLSNGDYQPGNFLAEDGKITGFLDFESPSFQDPMMGFVKYPIYDLVPLCGTNLVDKFLESMGFSREEFSIRLILGCLKVMVKEISPKGEDQEMKRYRDRVVAILKEELKLVNCS